MSEEEPQELSGAGGSMESAGEDHGPIFRVIAASRYLFVLAVVSTFLASVVVLVSGVWVAVELVLGSLGFGTANLTVREQALEIVDYFLVALALCVLSGGFYQLMIRENLGLPQWMRIHTPVHMERQLMGVIVTVMTVEALVKLANWEAGFDIVGYGLAVAAIIAAITFYVRVQDLHDE